MKTILISFLAGLFTGGVIVLVIFLVRKFRESKFSAKDMMIYLPKKGKRGK